LSVCSGGFDLQAATAVCAGNAVVPGEILDQIQGLVDKSLLAVERTAGPATRFRMLDFVRQYASERLAAAGEGDPCWQTGTVPISGSWPSAPTESSGP
jgi:predicted ATPase